jgi:purine-binding chemotaxis protein CheW
MAYQGDDIRTNAYLICRAGRHLCAMSTSHIIETMRILPIDALAGAPDFVRGMSVIRGTPVPVLDLPRLLNIDESQPQRLITINIGGRIVALLVDAVIGIRSIASESVSDLPPLLRDAAGETVSTIGILDAELLLFLNNMRIISESAIRAFEAAEATS